jgi:hypothetical protein
VAAIEKLVERRVADLQSQHGIEASFDDAAVGVAGTRDQDHHRSRACAELAGRTNFSSGTPTRLVRCWPVLMLQRGNSITAFRAKDNSLPIFSVYVPTTKVEYFPSVPQKFVKQI